MQFRPSPQVPALQYIGNVEPAGAAADAGLCTGDFLLEVSQTYIICMFGWTSSWSCFIVAQLCMQVLYCSEHTLVHLTYTFLY